MSILHIDSSARMTGSNTRTLSRYLVDSLVASRAGTPAPSVLHRDLAREPLPPITAEDLVAVHGSADSDRESFKRQLALSNSLIDELRAADTVVLAAPLYNFSVPAVLKQWIDAVCRAGVSFKYGEQGPEGLLGVKRAYIISGSGGTAIGGAADFASSYLEHICRFLGIEEVAHIDASGSKGSPELILAEGRRQIDQLIPASGVECVGEAS